jgi:large subunit ribosomal protein L13
MATYMANAATVDRKWYLVDAQGKTLGRLASALASRLCGKHKPEYTPHVDTGDFFVVINADKVALTGNKAEDKLYHHHTGYPGGIKTQNFRDMQEKNPRRALELAVKGMLPKGPLGRDMLGKLKIFAGSGHSHEAQKPQKIHLL